MARADRVRPPSQPSRFALSAPGAPLRPPSCSFSPSFSYGSANYQAVIKGYTGQLAGTYPKSWVKILLLILTLAVVLGLGWLLSNR